MTQKPSVFWCPNTYTYLQSLYIHHTFIDITAHTNTQSHNWTYTNTFEILINDKTRKRRFCETINTKIELFILTFIPYMSAHAHAVHFLGMRMLCVNSPKNTVRSFRIYYLAIKEICKNLSVNCVHIIFNKVKLESWDFIVVLRKPL